MKQSNKITWYQYGTCLWKSDCDRFSIGMTFDCRYRVSVDGADDRPIFKSLASAKSYVKKLKNNGK